MASLASPSGRRMSNGPLPQGREQRGGKTWRRGHPPEGQQLARHHPVKVAVLQLLVVAVVLQVEPVHGVQALRHRLQGECEPHTHWVP